MSNVEKYRRAVLDALRETGPWTPTDAFRWAKGHGGSKAAYKALRELVEGGRAHHYPKTPEAPERWEAA